ncbi:MAG TPA: extracellular solute-binding protein [bacterium]|nr:extracellular solute-binding protein [bacterium]
MSWRAIRILGFEMAGVVSSLLISLIFFPLTSAAQVAAGGDLTKIIEAARKEGTLSLSAPSTLSPRGAQALIDGMNKKWGLNLTVNFAPSTGFPAIVANLITEAKVGQPPSFDLVSMSDGNMTKLHKANLLLRPKWTEIFSFLPKDAVRLEGGAVIYATRSRAPAYNTKLLRPEELPKSWEDLGDPKWKGNMMVPSYADIWAYLSRELGEEKVNQIVQKIAANNPVYGVYAQIQTRLAAGEFPLTAYFHSSGVTQLKEKGAPVEFVNVAPIMVSTDLNAVVKGALHPNAAMLFAAFSVTPEGQEIWSKYGARSSGLIPGTPEWKSLQGKKYVLQDPEWFEEKGIELEKKYARILGLGK